MRAKKIRSEIVTNCRHLNTPSILQVKEQNNCSIQAHDTAGFLGENNMNGWLLCHICAKMHILENVK